GALGSNTADSTITLLQNLLVLAVYGDTGTGAKGKSSQARGKSVTLSVTAEQAQLVTHSEGMGKLQRVLRSPDDTALVPALAPTVAADVVDEVRRRRFQERRAVSPSTKAIEHVQ